MQITSIISAAILGQEHFPLLCAYTAALAQDVRPLCQHERQKCVWHQEGASAYGTYVLPHDQILAQENCECRAGPIKICITYIDAPWQIWRTQRCSLTLEALFSNSVGNQNNLLGHITETSLTNKSLNDGICRWLFLMFARILLLVGLVMTRKD